MAGFEISPPTYPLSREAFKRALMTGHGRALVHARSFDLSEHRDDILDAAMDCKVYDSQINGFREWWLAGLCESAGLVETVIGFPPSDYDKNRAQRTSLLKEFCLRGHASALPKLYAMCRRSPDHDEIEAIGELIEVEGERGLVHAARQVGKEFLADPGFEIDDWQMWEFSTSHCEGRAREILSAESSADPAISCFLEKLSAYESEVAGRSESIPEPVDLESVASVIEGILSRSKSKGALSNWGKKACSEDRAVVAGLLKGESRVEILIDVLSCLQETGLPFFDETLLGLVFHEDEQVRYHAVQMFSHHVEPQVRLAGLSLLERGDLESAACLLRLNAIREDVGLILAAVSREPADEDNHWIYSNLLWMSEENDSVRDSSIPLHIYEFSHCMHCRQRAIRLMIEWEGCPRWVVEEAAFDGGEEAKALAEGLT